MNIDWNKIRANYKLANQQAYFQTSYFGVMSERTVQVQVDCLQKWQEHGSVYYAETARKADEIRARMLKLTSADNHSCGLITDVSTAMNHLAGMFGDKKIALLDKDFPAVTTPWVVRKCDIVWIERRALNYDLKEIEEALKNNDIEVLALSWVMYNSGVKMDIQAIGNLCKKYDVVFLVDATQGLGANALDLSETHVDVLLASCFKWFLAGYGIGVAMASKDFESKYEIEVAGQSTVIDGEKSIQDLDNYQAGIRRFELGHIKAQQVFALASSLEELTTIGFENIQSRTIDLRDELIFSLEEIGISILTPTVRSSNIVMIEGNDEIAKKLKSANVAFTYRNGLIRFGVYFYNNEKDIERLIQALK